MPIRSLTFLTLTFAFSWGAVLAGYTLGGAADPSIAFAALALSMAGPAFAALVCAMLFEAGRRKAMLGLRLRPSWFWLAGWGLAVGLSAASVLLTVLLGGAPLGDIGANVVAQVRAAGGEEQAADLAATGLPLGPLVILAALTTGAAINGVILTLTEELGWRGYLHSLWRGRGFWTSSLAVGVIWGLWHAPAILLLGHNYPDQPVLGTALFVLFCTGLAPLLSWLRDRADSVIAPGIAHGAINALGSVTVFALAEPAFPWMGIVGVGGFAAIALAVAVLIALRPHRGLPSPRSA